MEDQKLTIKYIHIHTYTLFLNERNCVMHLCIHVKYGVHKDIKLMAPNKIHFTNSYTNKSDN